MSDQSYTTTFLVDQTPAEAFAAINNVRGWWSEDIEGPTDEPGGEFTYQYRDIHRCTMRVVEFVPDEKVVWHCLENYFGFTEDTDRMDRYEGRLRDLDRGRPDPGPLHPRRAWSPSTSASMSARTPGAATSPAA